MTLVTLSSISSCQTHFAAFINNAKKKKIAVYNSKSEVIETKKSDRIEETQQMQ